MKYFCDYDLNTFLNGDGLIHTFHHRVNVDFIVRQRRTGFKNSILIAEPRRESLNLLL